MSPRSISSQEIERLLTKLDSLPTLPAVAVRLINLTARADAPMREVAELIAADPALTSKVLSLVQSAAMAVRQPVTSVQQAVVLLGLETLRNLVLSLKVFEVFQPESGEPEQTRFNRRDFWKHSLAVATAAELLAPKIPGHRVTSHDAFVCGLLHDLGKVALATVASEALEKAVELAQLTRGDLMEVERRVLGIDHCVAGKRLAQAWHLPEVITQAIWLHGTPPQAMPQGLRQPLLIQLIGLADQLVRQQHIGFSGNYLMVSDSRLYLTALGLSEKDVADVVLILREQLEVRAKAIGLHEIQTRQLYLQSISEVNTELSRLNQTLHSQNRLLLQRSRCFEVLTDFYTRIHPAAGTGEILGAISQGLRKLLTVDRLVAFALSPTTAQVLLLSQTLEEAHLHQLEISSLETLTCPTSHSSEVVRNARPDLDGIRGVTREILGCELQAWLPLSCGEEWVGGIAWGAADASFLVSAPDLLLISRSWGGTLKMALNREEQLKLAEALSASNQQLLAMETQLVRSKSLSSVGEMAAGAAHEMNNPLAVICGRAQLLARQLQEPGAKETAQLIALQGQRLSDLVTELMDFARPMAPQPRRLDPGALLEEAIDAALEKAAQTRARIELEIADDLPQVDWDPAQITGALVEILLNAFQALEAVHQDQPILVRLVENPLDDQLIIQITDQGPGMDEETLRKAFNPFFSARQAGRRRGMGLAKALRWIENHGGNIRLDSLPDAGTTAVILLPRKGCPAQLPVSVALPS